MTKLGSMSRLETFIEEIARSQLLNDVPWCRVVVEGSETLRYVAERNLLPDETGAPVRSAPPCWMSSSQALTTGGIGDTTSPCRRRPKPTRHGAANGRARA